MDICIRNPETSRWSSSVLQVTPPLRSAYSEYKERPHYYREIPYFARNHIVYRPDNDPYSPTYIACISDIRASGTWPDLENIIQMNNSDNNIILEGLHGGSFVITREIHDTLENARIAIPIMDLNDVSVFIVDDPQMGRANWMSARFYQAWAYRDFMYDTHRSIKKSYRSPGTSPATYNNNYSILHNQMVTIDATGILPNIVFNISRNDNNSVYFERNDEFHTKVRICDNEYARMGYLGFYTRLTMDPGIVVIPPMSPWHPIIGAGAAAAAATLSTAHLHDPEETDDDEHQCKLCFKFRINTRFSPCEHTVCCSVCYSKLTKNTCPVCRAEITRVMRYV